ncbi:hypothetical protein B0F90DRAFT_1909331 [Multifurca ochricompacta]|uniref:T6SS Phospholipase effector Tle1-like catalytic domain-containing protein n=1 Tax=Multifurca ochricompacta TaxID=376703 RepID=A0AAD4MCS9_9AGAM|nr:hypothetical protein B0F90DRAFT_1909331 [Multifurca ochricompacta]
MDMDMLPSSPTSATDPSATISSPPPPSSPSTPSANVPLAAVDATLKRYPSRPSDRSYTDIKPSSLKLKKRIIVCCDGTWQDGVVISERWKYTNILRLSRAIHHVDERIVPPVPQIVFYQAGVGAEPYYYQALLDGATGATLGDKVQEAYTFIAHNYEPGDEIFLFGFSRGAYTARMVGMMIGKIGVLDRTDMDHFANIFVNFQARIEFLDAKLAPWTRDNSPGKIRAVYGEDGFAVKCIGVFDTVGSLGLPEELAFGSKKIKTLFGFPDSVLGDHIERAYQALALNETRADFVSPSLVAYCILTRPQNCNKFHLSEEGRRKKQVLKQCWFAGSHSDIGGGYKEHDLSDLALLWMAANIEDILSIDTKYLFSLLRPNAPWGTQKPHDPKTGIFVLANTIQRQLPTSFNPVTHESIHPSILNQMPFSHNFNYYRTCGRRVTIVRRGSIITRTMKSLRRKARGGDGNAQPRSIGTRVQRQESTTLLTTDEKSWLSRLVQETSFGAFIRDLI